MGGQILNRYDTLDELLAQTTDLGTVGYQYDALARRTEMTAPGQAPVGYTYDDASRLQTIRQAPLDPVTIDYDTDGRRTRLTLANVVSTEYQYDAASRVVALIYRNASGVLGDLTYQYDDSGSRTRVGGSFARTLLPDPVVSATYDAASRQPTMGEKALTYDANGNLTSMAEPGGTTIFTWDARNRLIGMNGPGLTASFNYDALGRRIQREINGRVTEYLYDGADILQELLDGMPVSYLRSLNTDGPLVRQGGEVYLADALGSTLALTDPAGTLQTQYAYESFGRTLASGASNSNTFEFTGRENDSTGLYYYRARYYDPQIGRFISEDPAGFLGGITTRSQESSSAKPQ